MYEIFNYKIKINSNLFYLIFLLFLLLLILQVQIQEINLDDKIYSFKSIIFLGISIFTVSYYSKFLLKNINLILNYFLIFLIYIVFFTFLKLDLHIINHQCYIGCFSILDDRFKFFKENSHVGFISSTLIDS